MQRVVFRVDASVQMGMGHLTRCLALANDLAEGGAKSCFLLRSHAAGLAGLVEANGHAVRLLADPSPGVPATAGGGAYAHWLPVTWREDAEQAAKAIDEIWPADWLIVDHYTLDAAWEQSCRRSGLRILAIDDLADRPHDCDILLDQNLVAGMETRYLGRVSEACVQLLGPRYALLRPEFAAQRRLLAPRSGEIDRILVCFGGSDPTNETAKALEAISRLAVPKLAVDVVIGLSNPHADAVAQLCETLPRTRLHRGADNVAELMRQASLSIGAGGVMSWERCCLGLPVVAISIAANQVGALVALAEAGAAIYLGTAAGVTAQQLEEAVRALLDDPARTKALGEAAFGLVDGNGCHRVTSALGDYFRESSSDFAR